MDRTTEAYFRRRVVFFETLDREGKKLYDVRLRTESVFPGSWINFRDKYNIQVPRNASYFNMTKETNAFWNTDLQK